MPHPIPVGPPQGWPPPGSGVKAASKFVHGNPRATRAGPVTIEQAQKEFGISTLDQLAVQVSFDQNSAVISQVRLGIFSGSRCLFESELHSVTTPTPLPGASGRTEPLFVLSREQASKGQPFFVPGHAIGVAVIESEASEHTPKTYLVSR